MKFFKKLAILGMALLLSFGVGTALTACGGDDGEGSNNGVQSTTFNFKVLNADDTPAIGYNVQLCYKSNGGCIAGVAIDADGTCEYNVPDGSVAYTVHIWTLDRQTEITDFIGLETIPANYNGGEIILKLKN